MMVGAAATASVPTTDITAMNHTWLVSDTLPLLPPAGERRGEGGGERERGGEDDT